MSEERKEGEQCRILKKKLEKRGQEGGKQSERKRVRRVERLVTSSNGVLP